ncbi:hypothetical protein G3N28_23010, partial [Desulfobacter hydrogenophilus]|uniref:hypothetical protein n=1 Tax=Desulfobacter hydrogenophilus TaxID=2291 RepID=UPI0013D71A27
PQFELSVTPAYQGKEDLRTGGQLGAHSAIVRASYTNSLNDGSFFGLTLGYDYKDYDISRHTALGAEPPWTIVRHIGVGAPIFLAGSGSWGYYLSPALEISRADGAKWSDSLQYGGLVAAIKQVDAQRRIGFGISLSEALERVYA